MLLGDRIPSRVNSQEKVSHQAELDTARPHEERTVQNSQYKFEGQEEEKEVARGETSKMRNQGLEPISVIEAIKPTSILNTASQQISTAQ